ncbi:hypothetical protein CEUSTIGMA_g10751.t1 [Chlamydomonas eustigma]|uniref:Peptidase S74 domain-containing protein n=1 Tax=Chlamydomonas eustigma TaxID=1157962 RepID=A0A250XJQ8_9CHLO|nr:hypothetical protein CEUSTIGMA_g10751.t1 [Chlamydomonas eustigma]|eukprot:GAX83325.1 hypothetical protein CEUSTIGMA_g10751.t1 [Chlamydomonas eustigma]
MREIMIIIIIVIILLVTFLAIHTLDVRRISDKFEIIQCPIKDFHPDLLRERAIIVFDEQVVDPVDMVSTMLKVNGQFTVNNDSNTFVINPSGNIGIGTSNPIYNVDVNGTFGVSGAATFSSSVSVNGTINTTGPLQVVGNNTSPNGLLNVTSTNNVGYGCNLASFGTSASTRIIFSDENDPVTLGPAIQFNAANIGQIIGGGDLCLLPNSDLGGFVGIGTTTPAYTLDVSGNARVTGAINASTLNMTSTSNPSTAPIIYTNGYNGNLLEAYFAPWDRYGLNLDGGVMRMYASSYYNLSALALSLNNNNSFTDLLYVSHGGNVGIGTTTPAYTLDVSGTARVNVNNTENNKLLVLYDGNAGDPVSTACNFYGFGINTSTLRYQVQPGDSHTFYNGTTTTFTTGGGGSEFNGNVTLNNGSTLIVTNGNVGETTPELATAPIYFPSYAGPLLETYFASDDRYGLHLDVYGVMRMFTSEAYTPSALALSLNSNNTFTDLLYVSHGGNVGIGTTNPQYNLDVVGGSIGTNTPGINMNYYTTNNYSHIFFEGINPICLINYQGFYPAVNNTYPCGHPGLAWSAVYTNDVYATCNVGIGTTTPQYNLDVNGNVRVTGTLNMTSGSIPATAPIYFPTYNGPLIETYFGPDDRYGLNMTNAIMRMYASAADTYSALALSLNSNNVFTDFLYVTHGGNVGIGTTTPAYPLDVNGTVRVNANNQTNNKLLVLWDPNPADAVSTATNFYGFGINNITLRYQVPVSSQHQFFVDTIPMFVVTSSGANVTNGSLTVPNGNIGIGTTTPQYNLDVVGDAHVSAGFVVDGLITANDNLYFASTSIEHGIYFAGTPGDTGNLSAPYTGILNRNYDPTGGSNVQTDNSELLLFQFNDFGPPSGPDRIRHLAAAHEFQVYTGVGVSPADTAAFWADNNYNTSMYIANNGYVGIGTKTPAYTLDVNNNIRAQNALYVGTNGAYLQQQTANYGSVTVSGNAFGGWYGYSINNGMSFMANATNAGQGGLWEPTNGWMLQADGAGHLALGLSANPNSSYNVTLDGSTNVTSTLIVGGSIGIGTTTPAYPLDVNGNARVTGTLNMTSGSIPATALIYFPTYNGPLIETYYGPDDRYGLNMTNAIMRMYASAADTYSALALSLNSNNVFTDFLYVTHGGNVGIGTTTPAYPLDVNGTARVNANNQTFNKLLVLWDDNAADAVSTATNFFGFGINGGTLRYQVMPGNSHTFYNGTTTTFTTGGSGSEFNGNVTLNNGSTLIMTNGSVGGYTPELATAPIYFPAYNGPLLETYFAPNDRYGLHMTNGVMRMFASEAFSTSALALSLNSNNTFTDFLYVTHGGNVGIGTTAPAYPLDVVGSVRVNANNLENNKLLVLYDGNAGDPSANYGTVTVSGYALNGWYGYSINNGMSFMANTAGYGGIWTPGNGWMLQTDGAGHYALGDNATPNASYNVTLEGSTNVTSSLNVNNLISGNNGLAVAYGSIGNFPSMYQGAGFQIGWDRNTGGGRTDFCGYGQNGAGGFDFWYANSSSQTPIQMASMQPGAFDCYGTITTSDVYAISNIGIGTTSPAYALDVVGTAKMDTLIVTGSVQLADNSIPFSALPGTLSALFNSNQTTFVINSSGYVGFGTSNPIYNVDVNGTFGVSGAATFSSSISVNGTISTTGNVGIGTNNPQYPLDVIGNIRSSLALISGTSGVYNNTNNYPGYFISATNTQNAVIAGDVYDKLGFTMGLDQSDSSFKIQVGFALASGNFTAPNITVTETGYVGISTTTPQYTLDVNGTARVSGAINASTLNMTSTSNPAMAPILYTNGYNGNLLEAYFSSSDRYGLNLDGGVMRMYASSAYDLSALALSLNSNNTFTDFLYVTHGGNVGFGTSNPIYNVDVNGTFGVSGAATFSSSISVNGTISTTGNVGIGTNNPQYPLDVIGNIRSSLALISGTSGVYNNTNNYPGYFISATNTQNAVIAGDVYDKLGFTMGLDQSDSSFKIQVGFALASGNFTAPNITVTETGYVGISTTTPQYNLDVVGDAHVSSGFVVDGLITANDNLYFASTSIEHGIYFAGTPGDYGNSSIPYSGMLNRLYDPTGGSNVQVDNSELLLFQFNDFGPPYGPDRIRHLAGAHKFQVYTGASVNPTDTAAFWADNNYNTAMYIANSGYVGIGTNTPAYPLDVNGTARVNATNQTNNKLLVLWDDNAADAVSTATNFYGFGINNYTLRYQVPVSSQHQFFVDTIPMFVVTSGGSEFNGNVTLNNGSVLTVTNGDVGETSSELATAPIYFPSYVGPLLETYFASDDRYGLHLDVNGVMRMFASEAFSTSALALSLNSNNTFTDFLYVTHGGNVGIGTTNPQYTLDVNGTCYVNNLLNVGTVVQIDPSGSSVFNNRFVINNALNVGGGSILSGGANVTNGSLTVPNGNVGIGTTTPQYNLDVVGDAHVSSLTVSSSLIVNDTINIPISPTGNGHTILFGSNTYGASPQEVLHVFVPGNGVGYSSNDFAITSGWGGYYDVCGITWNIYNGGNNFYQRYNDARLGWSILTSSGGDSLTFNCYGAGYLNAAIPEGVSTIPLFLSSSNVGINTNNPLYALDVNGTARVSGAINASTLNMTSGSVPDTAPIYFPTYNGPLVETYFGSDDRYGLNMTNAIMRMYASEADTYSALALSLNSNNTFTDFLYVTHGGNVGIGTTTPAYTLDVNGNIRVTGTLNMTSGSVPDTAPIYFPTYNGPLVETYFGSDDRYGLNMTNAIMRMYASEADTYSALALSLNSNNTFTDFLYVTHGGNVGIGTTAPAYPMDVNGTTRVNANNTENNKLLVLYDGNAGDPVSTACNFFGLGINGGTLRYQAMPGDSHTFYNGTTATFTTGGTNSTFYGTVSVNGATNVSSSLTVSGLINGQSGLAISYGSISPSLVTGNGGFQTGWNTVVGLGCTDFCSYGQGGPGGFDFWYANNANLTPTQMASMLPGSFEYNGTITATVTSNIGYGCNLGSFGTSVSTRILFLDENDPVSLGPAIQFNAANVGQIIGGGDLCLMPAAQRFVGIGTTSPSYMLDVNGSEFRDLVFRDNLVFWDMRVTHDVEHQTIELECLQIRKSSA